MGGLRGIPPQGRRQPSPPPHPPAPARPGRPSASVLGPVGSLPGHATALGGPLHRKCSEVMRFSGVETRTALGQEPDPRGGCRQGGDGTECRRQGEDCKDGEVNTEEPVAPAGEATEVSSESPSPRSAGQGQRCQTDTGLATGRPRWKEGLARSCLCLEAVRTHLPPAQLILASRPEHRRVVADRCYGPVWARLGATPALCQSVCPPRFFHSSFKIIFLGDIFFCSFSSFH